MSWGMRSASRRIANSAHARRPIVGDAIGLSLLLLLAGCAASPAAGIRYEHGWLLELDDYAGKVKLSQGARRLEVLYREQPAGSRQTSARDMAMLADGRLAVSVSANFRLGEMRNMVLVFDPGEAGTPPAVFETGSVLCAHIVEADGAIFCLGPNFAAMMQSSDYGLLHRVRAAGLETLLNRGNLIGARTASAWVSSPVGPAALLPVPGGGLLAWLPNARQYVVIREGKALFFELPLETDSRSTVTVALGPNAALYALRPLLDDGAQETLTTSYGLFVLVRHGQKRWQRIETAGVLARGTLLLAVEGRDAVLWDRRSGLIRRPIS